MQPYPTKSGPEGGITKKIYRPVIGVISMALAAGILCLPCSAQEFNVPQLPSDACRQLQSKINQMPAISDSTSMTDAAKVAELKKTWAETWKTLQETGKNDSEIDDMVKGFSQTLNRLIAMAVVSASSGNQEVSEDAKRALVDLKKQIKSYMSVMKMLCPRLVVPDTNSLFDSIRRAYPGLPLGGLLRHGRHSLTALRRPPRSVHRQYHLLNRVGMRS